MFNKRQKAVKNHIDFLRASLGSHAAFLSNSSNGKDNLSNFDACIEACDSLVATSHQEAKDSACEIKDCSLLISPDGVLLDGRRYEREISSDFTDSAESSSSEQKEKLPDDIRINHSYENEYESAVYIGYDLEVDGEKKLNGFSWWVE